MFNCLFRWNSGELACWEGRNDHFEAGLQLLILLTSSKIFTRFYVHGFLYFFTFFKNGKMTFPASLAKTKTIKHLNVKWRTTMLTTGLPFQKKTLSDFGGGTHFHF